MQVQRVHFILFGRDLMILDASVKSSFILSVKDPILI